MGTGGQLVQGSSFISRTGEAQLGPGTSRTKETGGSDGLGNFKEQQSHQCELRRPGKESGRRVGKGVTRRERN